MTTTTLRDLQTAQGAIFVDVENPSATTVQFGTNDFSLLPVFEPNDQPATAVHYGDPAAELTAARSGCAVFALPRRASLEITGDDRARFLHSFCTNDIKGLEVGQGCEALITNVKGRILHHVFVFADDSQLWLDCSASAEETLLQHLDRYLITEDVTLTSRTDEWGQFLLTGQQATDVLSAWSKTPDFGPQCGEFLQVSAVAAATIRRVDWFGSPTYLVSGRNSELPDLWRSLTASGATPAGELAFHTLRIDAGWPLDGVDISDQNFAQEAARTSRAVSFQKGCYLGQEPIARIDAMGHVNQMLRGVRLPSGHLPSLGAVIASKDEKPIGKVSSYAIGPDDHAPRMLSMLRRSHLTEGTEVLVQCDQAWIAGEVFRPHTLDS